MSQTLLFTHPNICKRISQNMNSARGAKLNKILVEYNIVEKLGMIFIMGGVNCNAACVPTKSSDKCGHDFATFAKSVTVLTNITCDQKR